MAKYVCAKCYRPSTPDEATTFDSRYTTGRCPHHGVKEVLIREDVVPVEKKKRKTV
jgi:DNA-directed RNA polymerase subunit RPC12/RpoP